ncbi:acyltransferase [Micromonospora sp. C28ISP2-4]|uniref:acyltransferase family protein n=1 Tax=Micromonospora sp. C28ISP2-4 TaxID=3059523 RepID=UPI00267713B3|nr:acyltransferase [Micromonospora sp. C28ISP2-4]MDO3686005.1 acyltransferase [Micromonospora sp. C28ISP2-4]
MTTALLDRAPTPSPVSSPPGQAPRLYVLDGLRLICALAVAGYHFGDSWRLDGVRPPAYFLPDAAPVLIYGFLGVETFFLISGFVILMSGWGRTVREFAASRAARLYPAFWVCVLTTTAVTTVLPISGGLPFPPPPDGWGVLVNLTMLAEPLNTPLVDTVYWTLWIELRFYLIAACILAAKLTDRGAKIFAAVWLAVAVIMPVFRGAALDEVVMSDFAPYFVAGITLFLLRRNRSDRWLWVLLLAAWLVSLQRVHERTLELKPGFEVPVWPAPVLLTGVYLLMLVIALGYTDRVKMLWLATAGALSYPFYLLHPRIGYSVIRNVYEETHLPPSVLIGGTVFGLLAAAWLVHRFVERPLAPVIRGFVLGRRRQ